MSFLASFVLFVAANSELTAGNTGAAQGTVLQAHSANDLCGSLQQLSENEESGNESDFGAEAVIIPFLLSLFSIHSGSKAVPGAERRLDALNRQAIYLSVSNLRI